MVSKISLPYIIHACMNCVSPSSPYPLMAVTQHLFLTVWSTAHLSVYTVLCQGLGPGQCCLVLLTLLCLVTKQADGMTLVRVKHVHFYISNSMLTAEKYDLKPFIAQCRWTVCIQWKALVQMWKIQCNLCCIMCHTNTCLTRNGRKKLMLKLLGDNGWNQCV